ncbi:hypothetical protein HYH03_012913 [Edaphochlamys debaryana]|uniref:Uncharacterized protein n=1 Tax=Edaphochlamys debaryana TaxID=47281 RepID=A0A835XRU2_9CHLO|nr:hypothetical protein HYH03_012913 [Edaphochlamys debaryana]|eukprot:KAG2488594.1 hypothetical protein HYH03_012913 [Edaphochlamys debaryana]
MPTPGGRRVRRRPPLPDPLLLALAAVVVLVPAVAAVNMVKRDGFESSTFDSTIWAATGAGGVLAGANLTCGVQLYGSRALSLGDNATQATQRFTFPAQASVELFVNRACPKATNGWFNADTRLILEYSTNNGVQWWEAGSVTLCGGSGDGPLPCFSVWRHVNFTLPFEEDTAAALRLRRVTMAGQRPSDDRGLILVDKLSFTVVAPSSALPLKPPPPSPPPAASEVLLRDEFERGLDSSIWSGFRSLYDSGVLTWPNATTDTTCGMQVYGTGAFYLERGAFRQLQPTSFPAGATFELFVNRVCPKNSSGWLNADTRLILEYSDDDERNWWEAGSVTLCGGSGDGPLPCFNVWRRVNFTLPFETNTNALLRFRRETLKDQRFSDDRGLVLIDKLAFRALVPASSAALRRPPQPPSPAAATVTLNLTDDFEQGQRGLDKSLWSGFAKLDSGLIQNPDPTGDKTCGMQLYGTGAFFLDKGAYRQLQPSQFPANAGVELFVNRVCPKNSSGWLNADTRLILEYSTDNEFSWFEAWSATLCGGDGDGPLPCFNVWRRYAFALPFQADTNALLRFRRATLGGQRYDMDRGLVLIDRLTITAKVATAAVPVRKPPPPSPPPATREAVLRDGFEQGQRGLDMSIWSGFAKFGSGLVSSTDPTGDKFCGEKPFGTGAFYLDKAAYRQLQPQTFPARATVEFFSNRVCPRNSSVYYHADTRLILEYSTDNELSWSLAWNLTLCGGKGGSALPCYNAWRRQAVTLPFTKPTAALLRLRRETPATERMHFDRGLVVIDLLNVTVLLPGTGGGPLPSPSLSPSPSPSPSPTPSPSRSPTPSPAPSPSPSPSPSGTLRCPVPAVPAVLPAAPRVGASPAVSLHGVWLASSGHVVTCVEGDATADGSRIVTCSGVAAPSAKTPPPPLSGGGHSVSSSAWAESLGAWVPRRSPLSYLLYLSTGPHVATLNGNGCGAVLSSASGVAGTWERMM